MTASEELQVDAHVLATSKLKITSRGYKALKTLLEHGNLLYCCLGKDDTLDLGVLLVHINFRFEFATGGFYLNQDSKLNYYYIVMNRKKPKPQSVNYHNAKNSIGKEERSDSSGWKRTQNLKND